MKLSDIARVCGVPYSTVRDLVERGPATVKVPRKAPCRRQKNMIAGPTGTRVRTLACLGYNVDRIAELLNFSPHAVADFLRRLEPVRKTELVRPRERADEKRLRANQAAATARAERRRLMTPPAGWANGDRFATGEARDWAQFMTTLHEARASGAEILGLASKVWFAPTRSQTDSPAVDPAIWSGPENPYEGAPKLTPEMIAEIIALRLQGWSTNKLAKRYAVTRATICYALSRRTFRELKLPAPPPFVPDPLMRPGLAPRGQANEKGTPPSPLAATARQGIPQSFDPRAGWANGDHNMTREMGEWKHLLATMAEARDAHLKTPAVIVTPFPFEPAVWTGPTHDADAPRQERGGASCPDP
jgi:transposase